MTPSSIAPRQLIMRFEQNIPSDWLRPEPHTARLHAEVPPFDAPVAALFQPLQGEQIILPVILPTPLSPRRHRSNFMAGPPRAGAEVPARVDDRRARQFLPERPLHLRVRAQQRRGLARVQRRGELPHPGLRMELGLDQGLLRRRRAQLGGIEGTTFPLAACHHLLALDP